MRRAGSSIVVLAALVVVGCPKDYPAYVSTTYDGAACGEPNLGPPNPNFVTDEDAGLDAESDAPADTRADAKGDASRDTHDAESDGRDADAESDARDADAESDAPDADARDAEADTHDASRDTSSDTADTSTPDATSADSGPRADTGLIPFDAGEPATRDEVDAILALSCSFSSCHGRRPNGIGGLYLPLRSEHDPASGKALDWYDELLKPATQISGWVRLRPGDPQHSWLAHKIIGSQCAFTEQCKDHDCGDRMPAANDALNPADVDTIIRWIRQGAPR